MRPFPARMYPNEVSIHRAVETIDDRGNPVRTVPDVPDATIMGSVQPEIENTTVDAKSRDGALVSIAVYKFFSPTDPGVNQGDQIRWDGNVAGAYPTGQQNPPIILSTQGRAIPRSPYRTNWETTCLETV